MKRFVLIFFSIVFFLTTGKVYAQNFESKNTRAGDNVFVGQDETIDRSFFASGGTVTISGTINGDLYVVGGTVIIDGKVNGDVLAAGGDLNITGTVGQDVRAAGGQITIGGSIGQNISVAGGNINIMPSAELQGSLVIAGGNVNVSTAVPGNLVGGVGNLTISDSIQGDIEAAVGSLTLTPQSSVSGEIIYYSDQELIKAQGASVSGQILRRDPEESFKGLEGKEFGAQAAGEAFLTTGRVMLFLSLLILGLLLVKFSPNYTQLASTILAGQPFKSAIIGFLTLVVTPFAAAILMITLIGLPIGVILLVTYFIYLYISRIYFIYWIGEFTSKKLDRKLTQLWIFIVGIVIYAVIAIIPIVGGLMKLIALLMGLGAMMIACKETYQKLQKGKLI